MFYALAFGAGAFFGLAAMCIFTVSGQESRKEEREQSDYE